MRKIVISFMCFMMLFVHSFVVFATDNNVTVNVHFDGGENKRPENMRVHLLYDLPAESSNLIITNTTTGTMANTRDDFVFTLSSPELKNQYSYSKINQDLSTEDGTLTVNNGSIQFALKSGEQITINGLQNGTYTLSEDKEDLEVQSHSMTAEIDGEDIKCNDYATSFQFTQDMQIDVTNWLETISPTGIPGDAPISSFEPRYAPSRETVNNLMDMFNRSGDSASTILRGMLNTETVIYSEDILWPESFRPSTASVCDYMLQKPEIIEMNPIEGEDLLNEISINNRGRIIMYDTNIDHPVFQSFSNDYYAYKNIYNDPDSLGAICLDCSNAADFSDSYNILYGHHTDSQDLMFGCLGNYLDSSYLDEHKEGIVMTASGAYDLTVFAVADTNACESRFYDITTKNASKVKEFLQHNIEDPEYSDTEVLYYDDDLAESTDQILALSTCQGTHSSGRLIVFAKMSPHSNPESSSPLEVVNNSIMSDPDNLQNSTVSIDFYTSGELEEIDPYTTVNGVMRIYQNGEGQPAPEITYNLDLQPDENNIMDPMVFSAENTEKWDGTVHYELYSQDILEDSGDLETDNGRIILPMNNYTDEKYVLTGVPDGVNYFASIDGRNTSLIYDENKNEQVQEYIGITGEESCINYYSEAQTTPTGSDISGSFGVDPNSLEISSSISLSGRGYIDIPYTIRVRTDGLSYIVITPEITNLPKNWTIEESRIPRIYGGIIGDSTPFVTGNAVYWGAYSDGDLNPEMEEDPYYKYTYKGVPTPGPGPTPPGNASDKPSEKQSLIEETLSMFVAYAETDDFVTEEIILEGDWTKNGDTWTKVVELPDGAFNIRAYEELPDGFRCENISPETAVYENNGSLTLNNIAEVSITYNANGGSNAPDPQLGGKGEQIALSTQKPVKDNYNFEGWATSKERADAGIVDYEAGATYTANKDTTLFAVWGEVIPIPTGIGKAKKAFLIIFILTCLFTAIVKSKRKLKW